MNHCFTPAPASRRVKTPKNIFTVTILIALLVSLCVTRAEGPDSDYLVIYGAMEQADALNTKGKTAEACKKYLEAQRSLALFRQSNPDWNSQMVGYRLTYLADKIKETSAETAATSANDNSVSKGKTGAATAKSAVKLISAGSEPRTVLRYHPAVGDQQTVVMTTKMSMVISAAGQEMPAMEMPTMTTPISVEVKKISPDGEITYGLAYDSTQFAEGDRAKSEEGAAMKAALSGLGTVSGEGRMSDRGIVKSVEMKKSASSNPTQAQMLEQIKDTAAEASSPLPDEAVGVGAKWEYRAKIKSQGIAVDQVTTIELVAVDGDKLDLKTTITQTAANQKIENPAMPGLKMDLTKLTTTGKGKTSVDLGHLLPASATMDSNSDTAMTMNVGQQKQTMNSKIKVSVTFEEK